MTQPVSVTINETPVNVSIADNTPAVTVTDLTTRIVTVIDAAPQITLGVDQQPRVIVNTGVGGVYDTATVLGMLEGNLDHEHMVPALKVDLEMLRLLRERVGVGSVLTSDDGDSILQTGIDWTNSQITQWASDISTTWDGNLTEAVSIINQTANEISLSVSLLEESMDGQFSDANSLIAQTAFDIRLEVSLLETDIDGRFTSTASSITQTASTINLRIDSVEADVDDRFISAHSEIDMNADNIGLFVDSMNSLTGRMESAELILGTDGIHMSTMEHSIGEAWWHITATQTMLTDRWGVSIESDVSGERYVSGITMLHYPAWIEDYDYSIADYIYHEGDVYSALSTHHSTIENAPPNASFWSHHPDGHKTYFIIQADAFKVKTASGSQEVFTVTDDVISLNTNVQIAGTLTIGPGTTGYGNITDRPASFSDINVEEYLELVTAADKITQWFYPYAPTLSNEPFTFWSTDTERDSHVNDLFYNTVTKTPYRLIETGGVYSWEHLRDPDIQNALDGASDALDLADHKRRAFFETPVPPYDRGDLWADGDTMKRCQVDKAEGDSFAASDWVDVADRTAVNVALDTTYVNGVVAALVEYNAEIGASFTSLDAGNIAYLNTIGATQIRNNAIETPHLMAGAVSAAKMAVGTITAASGILGNLAVETLKIADQAVTTQVYTDDSSTTIITLSFTLNVEADVFVFVTAATPKDCDLNVSIDGGASGYLVSPKSGAVTTIGASVYFGTSGNHTITFTTTGPYVMPGFMAVLGLIARK